MAIDRYAQDVLGFCPYTTLKDGGESPIRDCPSCQAEALLVGAHTGGLQYVCFECGEAWEGDALDYCDSCGELYSTGDESVVCDACVARVLDRDD